MTFIIQKTNNRGVDHVVEVAGAGTIMQAITATRFNGWIHSIGFVALQAGGNMQTLLGGLLGKNIFLRGVLIGPRNQYVSSQLNNYTY